MRILKFNVHGQSISKDPKCDFNGIASGTKNYLKAKFAFRLDWNGMRVVAVFKCLNNEYPAKVVSGECVIPEEALIWSNFSVHLIGENASGTRIKTNKVTIRQEVV